MTTPLSSDDLRSLADMLDGWNRTLINKDGEYKSFANFVQSLVIQLDDGLSDVIGHLSFEDGWIGLEFGQ